MHLIQLDAAAFEMIKKQGKKKQLFTEIEGAFWYFYKLEHYTFFILKASQNTTFL